MTLLKKIHSGQIPAAKIGKRWVCIDVDLTDYLRSQYTQQASQGDNKEAELLSLYQRKDSPYWWVKLSVLGQKPIQQAGTSLVVLKELGGWADYDMVQKYARLSSDHLAEHVERVTGKFEIGKDKVATNQLRKNAG